MADTAVAVDDVKGLTNPNNNAVVNVNTSSNTHNDKATIAKLSAQLKRLTEANAKYKSLLKLAKDRIEKQEQESDDLKQDKATLEDRLIYSDEREAKQQLGSDETSADDKFNENGDTNTVILRVCQRVKEKIQTTIGETSRIQNLSERDEMGMEEIWALMEMQVVPNEDGPNNSLHGNQNRPYKEWMRFTTEAQLQDFIRRDTGEPLTLPPYSLSPEQSAQIEQEAESQVVKVTEEFRRFRVRSELARKQADAQIRELQSINAQRAAKQIEGPDSSKSIAMKGDFEQARSANSNLIERLKAEMAAQETHWRESYDALLTENNALKSDGSEALLAAQWRQRYENCLREKENLESRLKASSSTASNGDGNDETGGKYEVKYRDLKESFRLYRKKAKEIFEAQQEGGGVSPAAALSITGNSTADAKISYLKNLMLNYLTADPAVRGHMEGAIGTVLQFSVDERKRVEAKKTSSDNWF